MKTSRPVVNLKVGQENLARTASGNVALILPAGRAPSIVGLVMQAQPVTDSPPFLSVEEYLESEQLSEVRHEYFDGRVFAMAGASDTHELIAMNLAAALHAHLKGKPCQVFKDGMKLRLQLLGKDLFYYPDVMVVSDPADSHRFYREKPRLLIEVLSEDENKDLVEKYFAYHRIPSVEEYVVVSQDKTKPEVRMFRRAEGWEPGETHHTGEFTLRSVSLALKLSEFIPSENHFRRATTKALNMQ